MKEQRLKVAENLISQIKVIEHVKKAVINDFTRAADEINISVIIDRNEVKDARAVVNKIVGKLRKARNRGDISGFYFVRGASEYWDEISFDIFVP